jgi:hypothetical protein
MSAYSPNTTIINDEPMTEGWTLTTATTTPTDDGWGLPPTTENRPDGWTIPPAAPSPPVSATGPSTNNHASLHWTACYDDYCNTHRQSKDNAYYPRRANGRHRRNHRPCECPHAHPFELAEVIRNRHLNPRKACADWYKGKRVCPHCRYLVNMNGHESRCGITLTVGTAAAAAAAAAAPPTRIPQAELRTEEEEAGLMADEEDEAPLAGPPRHNENQENEEPVAAAAPVAAVTTAPGAIQDLRHAVAVTRQTAIIAGITAQQARDEQRAEARHNQERHEADTARMENMVQAMNEMVTEHRRATAQIAIQQRRELGARLRASRVQRPAANGHHRTPHPDLAGASVWTGGLLSRTSRDRLLGAAAGAVITAAGLWLIFVSAATVSYVVRR